MRNIFLTTIIILWQAAGLLAQQVWPGDINNNGIVNNIDVLYWAVAKDATGEARANPTTDWVGQDLPATLWEQNFPEGLNYAYADCDGDGDVDDDDRTVIEENFGEVHGVVVTDTYATGDPNEDPTLLLSADNTTVPPGETLEANLSLGNEQNSITELYGIAFTLRYDPAVVSNIGSSVKLDIFPDTWLNGQGDDQVIRFINNDRDNGIVEIAIVRKNQVPVSGFGDIGTVSIVMEDIVVGKSDIDVTDIKTVGLSLLDFPVAPSELSFRTDTTLTSSIQLIRRKGLRLYPNPVSGRQLTVELEEPQETIRRIQLFDVTGRRLMDRPLGNSSNMERLEVGQLANGIYTLKVFTDRHLYVQSFFR